MIPSMGFYHWRATFHHTLDRWANRSRVAQFGPARSRGAISSLDPDTDRVQSSFSAADWQGSRPSPRGGCLWRRCHVSAISWALDECGWRLKPSQSQPAQALPAAAPSAPLRPRLPRTLAVAAPARQTLCSAPATREGHDLARTSDRPRMPRRRRLTLDDWLHGPLADECAGGPRSYERPP